MYSSPLGISYFNKADLSMRVFDLSQEMIDALLELSIHMEHPSVDEQLRQIKKHRPVCH
jgi:hypothetical protein